MLHLEKYFPRIPLGFFPSPIHKLHRLSKELGVNIWAKRDDVSSGLAYGGNKVRKLEWLAADAIRKGCDTLVSIGGVQSNHTRQVTAVAASLGLQSYTVQETWAEWKDPIYDKVGNILLTKLMGGNLIMDGYGYSTSIKKSWENAMEAVRRKGGIPYAIPTGASDHPLGGLGYANFADEIAMQEKKMNHFFDTIVTATCTGSTQAGMIVGFAHQKKNRRIIGIDTADNKEMTQKAVSKICHNTVKTIKDHGGVVIPFSEEMIEINENYSYPAYGIPNEETIKNIQWVATLEAMLTDPVYEGKSISGLISMCRSGEIPKNATVLYVHLGGTPAVNAYYKAFETPSYIHTLGKEARAS